MGRMSIFCSVDAIFVYDFRVRVAIVDEAVLGGIRLEGLVS